VIGETVSHYRVISEIGAGGMGVVYKAEDLRLGRFVALKFLPPQLMRDAEARQRLFAEARAASTLDHANVCTIYDVEELPDGRAFIAMAFVDGETLKTRVDRGPLPAAEAATIAVQVAHGLARAHQTGIVHRDVKPGNIMITSGGEAKLLDFGIAKSRAGVDLTRTGTTLGTIAYMAPEHVRGGPGDSRSDVWALGVVLHEMLTGKRLFGATDDYELLQAIVEKPIPPLVAPGIPGEHHALATIVSRALERDHSRRYADAGEMAHALEAFLKPPGTGPVTVAPARARTGMTIAVAAAVLAAVAIGGTWAWRSGGARTARNVMLPEALRLADLDRHGEAFLFATQAERVISGDPVLASLWPRISVTTNITSTPDGADVSFGVIGDDAWHPVGKTPLADVRVPRGILRWRIAREGFETLDLVRASTLFLPPAIDSGLPLAATGTLPPGMVAVPIPPGGIRLTLTGFDFNRAIPAPNFFIDRQEVTNGEFKAFVDAGGYDKREYWTEPFIQNGKGIEWADAMALFRDRTGRPGPATWQGGAPAPGQESVPVGGVSWYEAAAYAAFKGKQLPTVYHWTQAAGLQLGDAVTRTSNFGGKGPLAAAGYRGLGLYGAVDMAGNQKEWVWNEAAPGTRYILGGAWNDPDYTFLYSDFRSPFDRSETNGFRCIKDVDAPSPAALSAAIAPPSRNYTAEKPVSDTIYSIYAQQYNYDRTPLEPRLEKTDDSSPHWRREVVSIGPAYGGERLPIQLFLPKNVKPPFQTVLYFPGSGAIRSTNSADLPSQHTIDFVVLSGRALAFPIYKYTYERADPKVTSSWPEPTRAYTTWVQQLAIDARRTLDYVGTRPDLIGTKVAYFGTSWGARMSPIPIALDSRIVTGVLVMGGLGSGTPAPEADPFNFLPRVRVPILMINGDEDFIFPLQTTQLPFFDRIGTPQPDKRHTLHPGGHEIIGTKRTQVVQEVVAWLDKYLGRVQ
jgi:formylglycine-generating enzyme required for sulfatase activity/dienelactone hydrolase/predicted Ser/Thr protein kinase